MYGNAKVYGNAQVFGDAKVHHDSRVYGNVEVYGNAKVFDNTEVFGDAEIYNFCISREKYDGTLNDDKNEESKFIKDFVYKIDNSSKLDVQTSYDSVDTFFEDNSTYSYAEHKSLTIITVDTKVPILKLEKAQVKDQNVFKFIVDITTEDGAEYCVKDVINTKEKFNQLLQSTIEALNSYPQFSRYADDLENCI